MSNAFWSQLTRDLERNSSGLPEFEARNDEELRSLSRSSPARRGMNDRQYSSSMFPSADVNAPSPQPFEATRSKAVAAKVALTPQVSAPMPAAHSSDLQQLRDSAAADAAKREELAEVKIGLFSGVEDTELSGHDVAALFQQRVLESHPADTAIYHIDDSVPPHDFTAEQTSNTAMPGARNVKLSIHEVRGWIAHARSGGMSNSEEPVPPHLEPVMVPPSPRSRSPRTIVAQPDAGTYATADRTKGWREVVNKGAAESPSLRALRFGRREYGEQMQREFSAQVTFDFKKDPAAAAASLGLDGGIEDSADVPGASGARAHSDETMEEAGDVVVEGTDGMQSLSMAKAVAPDHSVYYAGADDEDARDAGPASYSPSFSSLTDPDFQAARAAAAVTSVVGLHGGVVVLTRDAELPAWAHAPAQTQARLPGNAAFPASVSVSALERAGSSGHGSRALAERAKAMFKELVDKRHFQKIRSALYFPHEFVVSGGFAASGSSGQFGTEGINAPHAGGRDVFMSGESKSSFTTADEDAQRQLMLLFDSDHRTVLHSACMRGDIDMLSVFLPPISKRVANQVLSCPDGQGRTCYHAAAISGVTEAMLAVMKFAGADHVRSVMRDVDNAGNTCLHLAAIRGHVSLCLSLLRVWSSPVEMYNIRGFSPLHEAIEGSHIAVVKMLLEECPHHALSTLANEARDTALHVAVRMRPVSIGILQLLVKYGCKGSRANLLGVRPTELAMQVGAWLAADIMDSSSSSDTLQDTRKEAQAAAAAAAAAAASGPRPPAATDYWASSDASALSPHSLGAGYEESAEPTHDRGAAYSGGDCEREVAVDADSACSYARSVDVIVVPPAAASSSERAMLAAPYTVAVRMRQHAHLPDAAPQSGEHGGRVAAADATSLHTAQGEEPLSCRVADLERHVHPSLALSLQVEQQQQLLYRDNLEKRPVNVDARLSTTASTAAAELQAPAHASPGDCTGAQVTLHDATSQPSCVTTVADEDVHDAAAPAAAVDVTASADVPLIVEVQAVMQSVLSSLELDAGAAALFTGCHSTEPADRSTVERVGQRDQKQQLQRAAVLVREEAGDRCAPSGDLSWLELEDCIASARASCAEASVTWTDWDELMEPPRRVAALPASSQQQQTASDACTDSQPLPPAPAVSSRFVLLPGSTDDVAGTSDYVDSSAELVYVGGGTHPAEQRARSPHPEVAQPPLAFEQGTATVPPSADKPAPEFERSDDNHDLDEAQQPFVPSATAPPVGCCTDGDAPAAQVLPPSVLQPPAPLGDACHSDHETNHAQAATPAPSQPAAAQPISPRCPCPPLSAAAPRNLTRLQDARPPARGGRRRCRARFHAAAQRPACGARVATHPRARLRQNHCSCCPGLRHRARQRHVQHAHQQSGGGSGPPRPRAPLGYR